MALKQKIRKMKAIKINISGDWAHFKKPETNNQPLTHDLITKTALIGMIGAVNGIERNEMKEYYPVLSEDLLYSVSIVNPLKKVSWGFTSAKAINPTKQGSPKYFEFLKKPSFEVIIALCNNNSNEIFEEFSFNIQNERSYYTPVLGWHNCPADISFLSSGELEPNSGEFQTRYFLSKGIIPKEFGVGRIGFDKLPTYQNNDFWNLPERYKEIIYPENMELLVEGDYYQYFEESLWLM